MHVSIITEDIQRVENALNNPDEFKQLITSIDYLCLCAKLVPTHSKQLIEYVLNNPGEFTRLFTDAPKFYSVLSTFPAHKNQIIEHVLKNPEEFKRIFHSLGSLKTAAVFLPQYASIFRQPTIEAAIEAASKHFEYLEIKKISRVLSALSRGTQNENSRFSMLPADILISIASHTTFFPRLHSQSEIEKMARDNFIEPPKI